MRPYFAPTQAQELHWQAMAAETRQEAPLYYRPVWHVNHLVYQGGNPKLKRSSLTGGGFIPQRSLAGKEAPSWKPFTPTLVSTTGGGLVPSRPNFLLALASGASTSQF